jgi:formate hydrogenlyase subunit 3/multisubunit Na+/H+ antiporter MnhD subunit
MTDLGKTLILFGAVLLILGAVFLVAGRVPWLGRLPGDIVVRRDHFTFYFPLTTCLLVSAILSFLLYWLRR